MARKSPEPVDIHVGRRVRQRRMTLGLSQEKLGAALGLTFQQVQKYERGTNRIGASRLEQISRILDCPISFFFDGLNTEGAGTAPIGASALADPLQLLGATREGIALAAAFASIDDARQRAAIVAMAQACARGARMAKVA
ncbi:MAG: helix-turn-helix transcriptional regulator [Pseudorhodoplanes sp.]|nr:helix-turn-helix transcriptional regulator [Pseudorhodoplanes sp.]